MKGVNEGASEQAFYVIMKFFMIRSMRFWRLVLTGRKRSLLFCLMVCLQDSFRKKQKNQWYRFFPVYNLHSSVLVQSNDLEVEEAVTVGLNYVNSASSRENNRVTPDQLDLLRARPDARDGKVVETSGGILLVNDLAAAGDTDGQTRGIGTDDDAVVDGVDGRLPVVGLAAARGLEEGAVPHGAHGLGATAGGHAGGVFASLVRGDEGGDEGLPAEMGPVVRVGVGEDLLAEAFGPVVSDVVTLTGVVLVVYTY